MFVVSLHSYFSPWAVTPHREVVAMHVLHLFAHTAVPLFFFISAFLFARDDSPGFAYFIRRKVRRVVVPLAFWMLAAFVYRLWQEGGVTGGMLKALALFDISGQFYYLAVLVVFYAGFYFVRDWSLRRLAWLAATALVLNAATIAFYQASTLSGDFATLAYRNPLAWVFFYAFGLFVGRKFGSLELPREWLWIALLGMLVAGGTYLVQGEVFDYYPVSYFGATTFVFSACALAVFPTAARALTTVRWGRVATAPFQFLSRYAFAIYLVHMPFFIGYLTEHVVSDSALADDYFKLMNGLFAVGFAGALAFVVLMDRIAPSFARECMGVEPRRIPRAKALPGS